MKMQILLINLSKKICLSNFFVFAVAAAVLYFFISLKERIELNLFVICLGFFTKKGGLVN